MSQRSTLNAQLSALSAVRYGLVAAAVALMYATASAQDDPDKAAFSQAPCEMCHGPGGSGAASGPALVPVTQDRDEFNAIVRQGVGHMPPIPRSDVSDDDLDRIYSYLKRSSGAPAAAAVAASGEKRTGAADLTELKSRLNEERLANDVERLRSTADAASAFEVELDVARAYAVWEEIIQSSTPNANAAGRVDEAIGELDHTLRLNDRGDVHAFRAALHALRSSLDKASPADLGGKIADDLKRARSMAPDDPRVVFLAGVSAALAPELAGGLDAAENELRRAETLLANARPADMWPPWKSADAAAWLGRVRFKRGDVGGARKAYERALELEPSFRWITRVLLPELTR